MDNGYYDKRGLTNLVMDYFDGLPKDKTPYLLGKELTKEKGAEFVRYLQEARIKVSSYISDLLVELFHPSIDEESELYSETRKRCLAEFIAGAVAALNILK